MVIIKKLISKSLLTSSLLSVSMSFLNIAPVKSATFDFTGVNGSIPNLGPQTTFTSDDGGSTLDVIGFKNIIPGSIQIGNISSNFFGLGIIGAPPTAPPNDPDTQVIQRRLGRGGGIIEGLEFVFGETVTLDSVNFITEAIGSQFSVIVDRNTLVQDPSFVLLEEDSNIDVPLTGQSFLFSVANTDSNLRIRGLDTFEGDTEITLNATDRGFYSETGFFVGNESFIVGDCRGDFGRCSIEDLNVDLGGEQRNFFVFDLSALDGQISDNVDAFLRLEIPDTFVFADGTELRGFASDFSSENYLLADVTTPIDELLTPDLDGGSPGTEIFADLGTGVFYSDEITITEDDLGTFIEIALNENALNDILNSLDTQFAISGAVTTLNNNVGIEDDEFIFGITNPAFGLTGPESVQLVFREGVDGLINVQANATSASTPEPTSLIGLLSIGALGFLQRNRKKN